MIPDPLCARDRSRDGSGISTGQPGRPAATAAGVSPGQPGEWRAALQLLSRSTSHKPQATSHKPQATGSEPRLNQL